MEILFLARKRRLRIREVPIDWYYRPQSKVRPFQDSLAMSWDVLRIHWFQLRGSYRNVRASVNEDFSVD